MCDTPVLSHLTHNLRHNVTNNTTEPRNGDDASGIGKNHRPERYGMCKFGVRSFETPAQRANFERCLISVFGFRSPVFDPCSKQWLFGGLPSSQGRNYSELHSAALPRYASPFCWATRPSALYILRSLGFSILPVGLRGTGAKITLRGRL